MIRRNEIFSSLAIVCLAGLCAAQTPPILTPPPAPAPAIHGPKVYGARPGHPFLYRIPVTGTRPIRFSAPGLPRGLKLDSSTGIITGAVKERGAFSVTLRAKNRLGTARRAFRIVIGDTLALTPPMGWSTWYMSYSQVSDKLVRAQADAMVSSGMTDHGYQFVNIDDGWNIHVNSQDPIVGGPTRNANGDLLANRNFPDMTALTGYIHAKGLKIGIYISPGPRTCGSYEGSYGHEEQDARLFSKWGFDFLKYDWCSYGKIAKDKSLPELQKPYRLMGSILKKQDRDFVFNLCQYGMGNVWEWGREVGGNFWRTTGDVGGGKDLEKNMDAYGFFQAGKEKWAGPGGWNDPDNILIGYILWDHQLRPTPLTPDEQYTYVSLWSILAAPMVYGGDMTKLDAFTLSLLTNDEVIDVNQDTLGREAVRVSQEGPLEVWSKDLEDGSKAVGLFNRGKQEGVVHAKWTGLGLSGRQIVRDLWRQKDLGTFEGEFQAQVAPHGVVYVRIRKKG